MSPQSILFASVVLLFLCVAAYPQLLMADASETAEPLRIDSRLELFVDDWQIDRMDGVGAHDAPAPFHPQSRPPLFTRTTNSLRSE